MGAFGKGNKQADLMAKMKEAKKQREMTSDVKKEKTREEIKEENDRKRFDDLLNRASSTNQDTNYLTIEQEEENASASYVGVDRLFEGDDAPTEAFCDLVQSAKVDPRILGEPGMRRLLPWMKGDNKDFLMIISDPRPKSFELRRLMKSMQNSLPASITSRTIVITSDTSLENFKYMKKNDITSFDLYSDEKRGWMKEYTALGENRWAMCVFIVANGRMQRIVRELDPDIGINVLSKVVNSLNL